MSEPFSYRIRRSLARCWEGMAGFGRALVSPFERFFAWLGDLLVRGGGGGGQVESGLVRLLSWPFRAVWSLLAAAGRLLFPESLRDGWHRLTSGIANGAARLVDVLNLDGPVRWIVWATQPLWRPIAAVVGFIYAWLSTRPYRQMAWGLPALVLLMPVVAAGGWRLMRGPKSFAKAYRVAAREALEADDRQAAELWERKLGQLGVDNDRSDYRAALTLLEDDDEEKQELGRQRMEQLAPTDQPGYPAAHFWMLQQLLSGSSEVQGAERLRLAEAHLGWLDELGIEGPSVDMLRAVWLMQTGRLEDAAELLEPLADESPQAAAQLMLADVELQRVDAARRDAARVRDHLLDAQRQGVELGVRDCQLLATACQIVGDAQGLELALRRWLTLVPDAPQAQRPLGQIIAAQLQRAAASNQIESAEVADLLVETVRLAPETPAVEAALERIDRRPDAVDVRARLAEALLADETAPGALLISLGTRAAVHGDFDLAVRLLERATTAMPESAPAWNNLAWALMSADDPAQREQSLAASNRAVELEPDSVSYRETRGQILVKLQRWDAAVADLEYALNGLPDSKPTHAALATALEALGENDQAAAHRALAD